MCFVLGLTLVLLMQTPYRPQDGPMANMVTVQLRRAPLACAIGLLPTRIILHACNRAITWGSHVMRCMPITCPSHMPVTCHVMRHLTPRPITCPLHEELAAVTCACNSSCNDWLKTCELQLGKYWQQHLMLTPVSRHCDNTSIHNRLWSPCGPEPFRERRPST